VLREPWELSTALWEHGEPDVVELRPEPGPLVLPRRSLDAAVLARRSPIPAMLSCQSLMLDVWPVLSRDFLRVQGDLWLLSPLLLLLCRSVRILVHLPPLLCTWVMTMSSASSGTLLGFLRTDVGCSCRHRACADLSCCSLQSRRLRKDLLSCQSKGSGSMPGLRKACTHWDSFFPRL